MRARHVVFALLMLAAFACWPEARQPARLDVKIEASDSAAGARCLVKISADGSYFYSPVLFACTTGARCGYDFKWKEPIREATVVVECEGFEPEEVKHLTLTPGRTTEIAV